MLKKLIYVIIAVIFSWNVVIPNVMDALAAEKDVNRNGPAAHHFPESFEESRERFAGYEYQLQEIWKNTESVSYSIGLENLTIDMLKAEPEEKKNLLILSSGTHGIEGYTGSAMQNVFMENMLNQLPSENTGVWLIHSINPWGMKNFRRYNENNVDLNRNFIHNWEDHDYDMNTYYTELKSFFQPEKHAKNPANHDAAFFASLIQTAASHGTAKIETALLSGQYTNPEGVYFGGTEDEPSTKLVKDIMEEALNSEYENIVHIDIHTGYGPRYQMSIFSSIEETMTQNEAEKAYNYPLVFTPETEEYYVTTGDITEYFYKLKNRISPEKSLYSTTFEFGTLGEGTAASIQSLKRTVEENQNFQYPSQNHLADSIIKRRYKELFYPAEGKWRDKAAEDFQSALQGVLAHEGFLHRE
ncbi:DUF2817 domain-containing protein [Bacillus lacus]|uniref:DUF2817 domain-containing protein n=1 Tax=Metabacillus lacus TaxID=1983721 RepID=A0A7X2J268_9BACI|nr:M14 family metallopeptidase [Metabacillus lacus]MRX74035.1 DUF2817 domain-containing protein [Metabacillus lacus]